MDHYSEPLSSFICIPQAKSALESAHAGVRSLEQQLEESASDRERLAGQIAELKASSEAASRLEAELQASLAGKEASARALQVIFCCLLCVV